MQLKWLNREVVSSDDKVKGVTMLVCAAAYVQTEQQSQLSGMVCMQTVWLGAGWILLYDMSNIAQQRALLCNN